MSRNKVIDITGPGPTTSSTPAPSATFPDCTFETGECGWVIDTYDDMLWYTTNTAELLGLGLDSPKEDFDGNFIYVNAFNGSKESSTIFGTPMVEKTTLQGCMNFHFSLNVSNFFICCIHQYQNVEKWWNQILENIF